MASVFDAAKYLLRISGRESLLPMTTWKLQILVYYAQGWSLVRDGAPLFPDRIEAWASGPVCPALHKEHRSTLQIRALRAGDVRRLNPAQKDTMDAVARHGPQSARPLGELMRQERPWTGARRGLAPQGAEEPRDHP
jgi:uncharacterized phage-associated protein